MTNRKFIFLKKYPKKADKVGVFTQKLEIFDKDFRLLKGTPFPHSLASIHPCLFIFSDKILFPIFFFKKKMRIMQINYQKNVTYDR